MNTPVMRSNRRAERLAYRRSTGSTTVPTLLSATRDVKNVQANFLGTMNASCASCQSKFWIDERKPSSSQQNPVFYLCCRDGKINLPTFPNPPPLLLELLEGTTDESKHFRNFIRAYNSAFSFTSSGANFDRNLANNSAGVYTFRIQGDVYHQISKALLPLSGHSPSFAQIYIYDTDYQIERRNSIFPDLHRTILEKIHYCLNVSNPFVHQFQANNEETLLTASTQEFELRVGEPSIADRHYAQPTGSKIAVLMTGDGNEGDSRRSIVLRKRGGGLQFVNQLHGYYDPLHFVLLFPDGSPGWSTQLKENFQVTMKQFYAYHFMVCDTSRVLHLSGRLFQEYVVDAYAKVEESRLHWVRCNQTTLHGCLYRGLVDQVASDNVDMPAGGMIILPPTFTSRPRYMQGLYQDAMAIVRKMGKPDLFITITCNPKWPEITQAVLHGQKSHDRFDICCRIFRLKLKELLRLLIEKEVLGKVNGRVYVVEFQKRGLPHAHMLLVLDTPHKPKTPEGIDKTVCAEIPDPSDKDLFDCVTTHMIHGPCGSANPRSPCMKEGKCSKKFPKEFIDSTQVNNDGYPLYRRRNNGQFIQKGSHVIDNRWLVPYNKYLCKAFNCHINLEICSSVQSVKYLYKYVYKGHDRIQARVSATNLGTCSTTPYTPHDEAQEYLDARYVSASEAFWRICKFSLQKMYQTVFALQVHDENMQTVVYAEGETIGEVMCRSDRTPLTEWMRYNREHPDDIQAKHMLYCDFPSYYTWNDSTRRWTRRQRQQCIGRVHFVCPRDTARYYLRLMLHHVPGATCFDNLRTVAGVLYDTYQGVAAAHGLLHSDAEFDNDLSLAVGVASPRQVRELYAMMLLYCEISNPLMLLQKHLDAMSDDIRLTSQSQDPHHLQKKILILIDSILYHNGSSLASFPGLPRIVEDQSIHVTSRAIHRYNIENAILTAEHLQSMLNEEQRQLYDVVFEAIEFPQHATMGNVFFVDGPGGSGKTFLYSAILAKIKASRLSALSTATSGIAALLLESGRTLHSTFKIPIPVTHVSTCGFSPDSMIGLQIQAASIIIVDEASMMHCHVFETLDRSIRDVMKTTNPYLENVPFGGKVVVMGGDFRQMLPVIQKGSRAMIINSALNRSEIWRHCSIFRLKTNVRVSPDQRAWSEFLLAVGEGRAGTDVCLPNEIRRVSSLTDLISQVYGSFDDDETQLLTKTILTPLNDDVVEVNNMVLDVFPGETMEYLSSDAIPPGKVHNESLYPIEFLNTIDDATMPLHRLRLKIGCIIILIRNLNTLQGLCNGTRLRVVSFFPTMVQVSIISQGNFYGQVHLLPRMSLYPSQSRLPFRFKRLQFPIRLAFAMTINKSQGQTLDTVGIYLPNPLFTHGQLYVTLSRTRLGPTGIVFCDGGKN
ncbi:uncharacterized protein LOC144712871 isoform X2 [Wolffia australiana]